MSAYQKSIDLNLDGTDAQKVAILQTISNSDISRANLASWLARKGLLDFDGNTWFGLLQDKIDDSTITGPLLLLLKQLKSVVLSVGGESLRTTTPPFCVQVYAGLSGIASAVPAAATLCSDFYDALDGGRPYKDLTVEEFAAQRTDAEAAIASGVVSSQANTILNESVNPAIATGDRATIIAAFEAAAVAMEHV